MNSMHKSIFQTLHCVEQLPFEKRNLASSAWQMKTKSASFRLYYRAPLSTI